MDRPTKITVTKINADNYEIVCIDEMTGSATGMNIPLNGYKALAEHFRTGVMEISSDELSNCNKPHVNGCALVNEVRKYRKEQAELFEWTKKNGHPKMASFDEGGLNACDKLIAIIEKHCS